MCDTVGNTNDRKENGTSQSIPGSKKSVQLQIRIIVEFGSLTKVCSSIMLPIPSIYHCCVLCRLTPTSTHNLLSFVVISLAQRSQLLQLLNLHLQFFILYADAGGDGTAEVQLSRQRWRTLLTALSAVERPNLLMNT